MVTHTCAAFSALGMGSALSAGVTILRSLSRPHALRATPRVAILPPGIYGAAS